MKELNSFQKIIIFVLAVILFVSQVHPVASQADESATQAGNVPKNTGNHFSSVGHLPSYSGLEIRDLVKMLGIKTGQFRFYLDDYTSGNLVSGKLNDDVESTTANVNTPSNHYSNAYTNGYQSTNLIVRPSTVVPTNTTSSNATSIETSTVTPANDNPITQPTSEPTVASTSTSVPSGNLAPNPSFENAVNGWAANWTKDGDAFSLDTNSQGNDGSNSIHYAVSLSEIEYHIFSEKIDIDPTATYQWSQYVKHGPLGSDLNYYIDEYDAGGNWISGQWRAKSTTTGVKTWNYIPTSTNVKSIRLQYSVTSALFASDIYLDSIYFGKN